MTQKRFGLYNCRFVHAGGNLDLAQLGGASFESGANKSVIIPGGLVDPAAIILSHAEPMFRLQTGGLAALIGAVSPTTGLACTSGATFGMQQRAAQGIFSAGSTHAKVVSTLGFLYIDSISCSQDDPNGAVAEVMYVPLYDGTNAPLAFSASQALVGTPAFGTQFFMGPVTLNGSALDGLQSWRINLGITFAVKRADGDSYARKGSIVRRTPSIELTFDNAEAISSGPASLFNAAIGSNLIAYARKGVHGGIRVADATAEHLAVTAATGAWHAASGSVQGEEDWTTTIRAELTGTIAVSVSAALA